LLPTGITPITNDAYGEKFKDTLDDFLIASICGHFGVQPTEIGYSPKGGALGGKGYEDGKANSAELVGVQPIVNYLNKTITNLSYAYLGMPRELEFRLMVSKSSEDEASARKSQIEITSAGKTVNERRSELGLPLLDTPQADMPILVSGSTVYLFSPDGLINPATATSAPQLEQDGETKIPATSTTPVPTEEIPEGKDTSVEVAAEVKAFMKWAAKGQRKRDFDFNLLDPIVGEALNRCATEGDLDTARSLAKAYLA
jgi:hypothetical protein